MKKGTNYIQCSLLKNEKIHHMAWIPEKFAVIGNYIKIKKDDGTWDDGWKVTGDGERKILTAKDADQQSQLYKKTRKASDI
jgi:hypothetical protein